MRLAIVGGGGFRVPLVLQALRDAGERSPITEVVLHDVDPGRLRVMADVWTARVGAAPDPAAARFTLHATTDLDAALRGASVVFSAIRVGGTQGRVRDERAAMAAGLLGQETVGAGGLTYALRTVPVADRLTGALRAAAPDAWCLNFTNPAGLVTEAMRARHERTVGICDTPIGLVRRALRAAGRAPGDFDRGRVAVDYAGLNHLGWLLGLHDAAPAGPGAPAGAAGPDLLPGLLADDAALGALEEARLIGADWVRAIGALPSEYVYYYLHGRASRAALAGAASTRGEDVAAQQAAFYAAALADPPAADALWRAAHAARDASYMATERAAAGAGERDEADLGGGYHEVAVDLMCALLGGEEHRMILDVPNRYPDGSPVVPGLDTDTVVEVPVLARRDEVLALPQHRAPAAEDVALMARVRAAERLLVAAARSHGSERERLAWRALAAHPVVGDVGAARAVLAAAAR